MASIAETLDRAPGLAPARRLIARIAREPLTHFLVIGAVLFAGLQIVRGLERPTVRIDEQEFGQMMTYWALQSGRAPTRAEMAAIVRDRVDEELLAAEAKRLDMDKGDMIIRRRLAQKMAFASEDLGAVREPDEAALRAYYASHAARYAVPGHIALRQVFFSADRGSQAAQAAAAGALARLRAGEAAAGDPFVLPPTYADVSLDDLSRDYGAAYVKAVQAARPGDWIGPLASPFGVHLVQVEGKSGAATPPFEKVRSDVRDDWVADRCAADNAAFMKRLRRRYRVVVVGEAP